MIAEALQAAGLRGLSPKALDRLVLYGHVLMKWNSRMNLTAIRDADGILQRHIVESVAAAEFLPVGIKTLLDFGSGAGLPGVPIAICREEVVVTLAESQSKRAAFLAEVSRSIGVPMQVHAGRVSAMPAGARFDVVTLRAVDRMEEAVREARGRVATGGHLLLFGTAVTRGMLLAAAEAKSTEEKLLSTNSFLLLCRV